MQKDFKGADFAMRNLRVITSNSITIRLEIFITCIFIQKNKAMTQEYPSEGNVSLCVLDISRKVAGSRPNEVDFLN
jgi:hypothetical protein